jgi:diacylglycerol kinase (ATP)
MNLDLRVERVKSLAKSFKNAFQGVYYCIRNERNMRIHLVVAVYVLIFSCFYYLTALEYAVLLLIIGMVIFAEAVNTAIEATVNLQTQCYDNIARIAKDVAAGSVLIASFFALVIGVIFFLKIDIIIKIVLFLIEHPLWGGLLILSLPVSVFFIFNFPFRRIKK